MEAKYSCAFRCAKRHNYRPAKFVASQQFPEETSRSPYPSERYLHFNVAGAVLATVALSVVGFVHDDELLLRVNLASAVVAVAYGLVLIRLAPKTRYYLAIGLLAANVLVSQWALPAGPAAFAVALPACLSAAGLVRMTGRAVAVEATLVLVVFALHFGEYVPPNVRAAPVWVTSTAYAACALLLTLIHLTRARKRHESTSEALRKAEQKLARTQATEAEELRALQELNAELHRSTEVLAQQMHRQAQLTDQLRERQAEEAELVNAIHQDLRQPLRSIVSFSQLIARGLASDADRCGVGDYLAYAQDGGQRMARMLDDLLAYASGEDDQEVQRVNLNAVVQDVLASLHNALQRSAATVEITSLPTIYGHPTQWQQFVQNMLANALKFRHPDRAPHVTLRAEASDEGACVLYIADRGIGIPAAQLPKVFGLFNRAHETAQYEGSGVGLALCRRIAIAHNGTLSVKSTEGVGSTFVLELPAHRVFELPSSSGAAEQYSTHKSTAA